MSVEFEINIAGRRPVSYTVRWPPMDRQDLDPQVKEAVKQAVREVASPSVPSFCWEAISGFLCLLLYFMNSPEVVSGSGSSYLLNTSLFKFISNFVLLAFSLGLSFSAARQKKRGRIIGVITFGVASLFLGEWLHFFWREGLLG